MVRASDPDATRWSNLPFTGRYLVDSKNRLTRMGKSVPSREMPESEWSQLDQWIQVPRPDSVPGGLLPAPVRISPERRRGGTHEIDLLVTSFATWAEWALTAPLARLQPLKFAASSDGRVCLIGKPLPPIPGDAWVLHQNIAVRAGFGFPNHCHASWLESRFELAPGSIALWHEDGSHEILPAPAFLAASRSHVRATLAAMETED